MRASSSYFSRVVAGEVMDTAVVLAFVLGLIIGAGLMVAREAITRWRRDRLSRAPQTEGPTLGHWSDMGVVVPPKKD
jgi:hypothetical protein